MTPSNDTAPLGLREALRMSVAQRTLADVLADIQRVGPVVWNSDRDAWNGMSHAHQSITLDRLDELQAEARALIESATGCEWDAIQGACL